MKSLILLLLTLGLHAAEKKTGIVTLDASSEKNLRVETAIAEEGTFAQTITALGRLEAIPEKRSVLSSRIPGRIIESNLALGTYVEKNDELVLLESRQPGDPPPSIWLKAPADGTILSVNAVLGSPVEPTDVLCEIAELKEMYAIATLPQHQAALIEQGTETDIILPLKPDKKLRGTLLKFSACPCPDPVCALGQNLSKREDDDHEDSNSAGIIFTVKNPDNQLRPGMKAQFVIHVRERKNVMSIPREALQGDGLSRFVFIRDYELKHAFVRVPVTTGEINAERVEILSGLFPGDEVVTRGSYALSFAGKGNVSLKDALDAAHGHPHNEDGTEMTKEEIAAGKQQGHDHDHAKGNDPLVLLLSIACGILLLLLVLGTWGRKIKAIEAV
jgi:cobalt-zinc-cadmium efflux system membrane fusion protein